MEVRLQFTNFQIKGILEKIKAMEAEKISE